MTSDSPTRLLPHRQLCGSVHDGGQRKAWSAL